MQVISNEYLDYFHGVSPTILLLNHTSMPFIAQCDSLYVFLSSLFRLAKVAEKSHQNNAG